MSNETSRLKELTSKYIELRDKQRSLEAQVDDLKQERGQVEMELVPILTELDAQSIKLEGMGTVYLQTKFYVKAVPDQNESLVKWLDDHELGAIAKRTVHHKTLESEYQRWSEGDMPLPPTDMVQAYPKTEVRVRKS